MTEKKFRGLLMRKGGQIIEVPFYQEGGVSRKHTYDTTSRKEQDIPESTLIDRTGKHPRYTYVPGRIHSQTYLNTYRIKPNLENLKMDQNGNIYQDNFDFYTSDPDKAIGKLRDPYGHSTAGVMYDYPEQFMGTSTPSKALLMDRLLYQSKGPAATTTVLQDPGYDVYVFPDGTSRKVPKKTTPPL